MKKDYYAILGLPRTATPAEIDTAFRSLVKKYHPDVQPEAIDATAKFKLGTEAHEVLSNAEKRQRYDQTQQPQRRVPVMDLACMSFSPQIPWPNKTPIESPFHVEAELRLVPEEARRGGSMELLISIPVACPSCGGPANSDCLACGSQRTVAQRRLVRLQLPPGLADGTVLTIPEHRRAAIADVGDSTLRLIIRIRPCW